MIYYSNTTQDTKGQQKTNKQMHTHTHTLLFCITVLHVNWRINS